jgi:NitT/TauT family transport system permease protein
MSDATPPAVASPRENRLFAAAKRLGTSVLPFVVVILVWQFASLFFPRFLFPSLIDVFWRCIDIFSSGAMFGDVLATIRRCPGWCSPSSGFTVSNSASSSSW